MRFGQDYGGTKFNEGFQRDMATKGFLAERAFGTVRYRHGGDRQHGRARPVLCKHDCRPCRLGRLCSSGWHCRRPMRSGSFQNAGNNYMQMSMLDRIMGRGVGSGAVPNGSAGNNWSYV